MNRRTIAWAVAAVCAVAALIAAVFILRPDELPGAAEVEVVRAERTRSQDDPILASSERVPALSPDLRSEKGSVPAASDTRPGNAPAVPGQLVLTYSPGSSPAQRRAARTALGVKLVARLPPLPSELVSFSGRSVSAVRSAAAAHPSVEYAEPNFIYRATDTKPNDPAFKDLWGLENNAQSVLGGTGVADADIDAPQAWDTSTGSRTLAVGVVDTGIDLGHVDLAPNIWTNPGETGGGKESNGVDDDNNGYVDDWRGWDWVDRDNDGSDLHGHGTHVAGTIAARGGDGYGVTGVNWTAGLVPLRVLGADGSGTSAGINSAFAYAGEMGIPVVNASLGGPGASQTLSDTINRYPDTLYVVAAGNDGSNNDTAPQYPCDYDAPNLICVASTTNGDQLSNFSNFGTSVHIAAPGSGILSTVPAFTEPFRETFETDLAGRWSGTGGWGRGQDVNGYYLADSPGSGYSGASESLVSSDVPADLSGGVGCRLRYDLRLDIVEANDLLVVEASDGATWRTIARWSGSTSSRWASMNEPLESFDGHPATYVRFRLVTVEGSQGEGVDIDNVRVRCLSSAASTRYSFYSGTSMASPHVAGAAALAWAAAPNPSVPVVKKALLQGGDPLPELTGKVATGARLNVARAFEVLGVTGGEAPSPAPPPGTPVPTSPPAPERSATATPAPSPSGEVTPDPVTTDPVTPAPGPTGPTPTTSPAPTRPGGDRSVSLRLKGALIAKGRVTTIDGLSECVSGVPIKVFRNERRVAKTTSTGDGSYRVRLQPRSGRYVAVAPSLVLGGGIDRCGVATSHRGGGTMYRAGSVGAVSTDDACLGYSRADLDLAASLDRARADAGLSELLLDEAMSDLARAHTNEMASTGAVSNMTPEVLRERLGEGVAFGQSVGSGSNIGAVVDAFLNSATLQESIVEADYQRVGVATANVEGRAWVTILFSSADRDSEQSRCLDA